MGQTAHRRNCPADEVNWKTAETLSCSLVVDDGCSVVVAAAPGPFSSSPAHGGTLLLAGPQQRCRCCAEIVRKWVVEHAGTRERRGAGREGRVARNNNTDWDRGGGGSTE